MSLENPKKQSEEGQEGTLSKLRRKTKGLAKALVFTTALTVGCDNFSNQPKKETERDSISEAVQLINDKDEDSRKRFTKLLLEHPDSAMTICRTLIPRLRNPEIFFEIASRRAPKMAILYVKDYKLLSNADKIFREAAENILNSDDPESLIEFYERYKDLPSAEEILEKSARKIYRQKPHNILEFSRYFLGKKYAQEILEEAFKADPYLALKYGNDYVDQDGVSMRFPAGEEPNMNKNYDASTSVIISALGKSNDPVVNILNDLSNTKYPVDTKKRMALFLQSFVDKKISFEKAAQISDDNTAMFATLSNLLSQPNIYGKLAIEREFKEIALKEIRAINDLHDRSDAERFKFIEKMGYRELYALIVSGEEEIFTSTFNGFFNRLTEKLKKENISGDQLLKEVGHNQFRTFIKMTAGYDRLNVFLKTMKPEEQAMLLKQFVQNIEKVPDILAQAVSVADTFGSLKDPAILGIVQKEIISEYQRVQKEGNLKGETLYGLLAGLFKGKIVTDDNWLREVAAKYKLPSLEKVSSAELSNPDGTNVQQYFFYNDADGKGSFDSFIDQYKNKSEWNIEQKGDYLIIKSISGRNRKKIEIYANFPEKENEGVAEIEKELKKKNIQSIVVVHRGHSYHAQKTIERIPNIAKIVSLGSCGGYNNLDAVLKRAPGAHIISTKGTGTMYVNDPLLKMLNTDISNGHDVEWNKFWAKVENKLGNNKDFKSYVPPHKNLGALFIKAYNSIIKEKKK